MRHSLVLAAADFPPLVPIAQAADAAGLHRVWTTEYNSYDSMVRATTLGLRTDRIQVGTGIAYHFTRAPVAAAVAAAEIAAVTGGRFTLGLGAGTRGMRSRWYGIDHDRPAARYAEYVALVKAVWQARDGLEFAGEFYRASIPGFGLGHGREILDGLRVYGSGLNAHMLSVAAASCDGVALHPLAISRPYLTGTVLPALKRGADRAGRTPSLAAWLITSIDQDEAIAHRRAQRTLTFYFTTPSYRTIVAGTPFENPVEAIREGHRTAGGNPDWDRLADHVTDGMVDDLTLTGTPDGVAGRLAAIEAELAGHGVDELVFQTVGKGMSADEVMENCHRIVATARPTEGT